MKLIQINERHYKLKKGNKVIVEFIKLRNNLWSAISGNIGIVNDKDTLEDCILKYNAELKYLNTEFIKASAETCKKIGVTAKEWNENKMPILMKFAANVVLEKY